MARIEPPLPVSEIEGRSAVASLQAKLSGARMLRRCAAVSVPRAARSFKKVAAVAPVKKKGASSRDQYGAIKQAILAEPDEELYLPTESTEEMEERKAQMSRMSIREHFAQNVAMNAGVKLRKAALAALPEALREEARQPDLTPFPVLRRVFTETAPIPGFQAEVRRTDRG